MSHCLHFVVPSSPHVALRCLLHLSVLESPHKRFGLKGRMSSASVNNRGIGGDFLEKKSLSSSSSLLKSRLSIWWRISAPSLNMVGCIDRHFIRSFCISRVNISELFMCSYTVPLLTLILQRNVLHISLRNLWKSSWVWKACYLPPATSLHSNTTFLNFSFTVFLSTSSPPYSDWLSNVVQMGSLSSWPTSMSRVTQEICLAFSRYMILVRFEKVYEILRWLGELGND